jgi:transcriptional regulator with XRE-family HTH domain
MADDQPILSGAGARIRAARRERGWSQDDLAAEVGVSRSAVAQWETDRAGQIRANLARVSEALQVSIEYLLYGEERRGPARASSGDELALLRLYRECTPEDRQLLLRTAQRLVRAPAPQSRLKSRRQSEANQPSAGVAHRTLRSAVRSRG